MGPSGIVMFYGAMDCATALVETFQLAQQGDPPALPGRQQKFDRSCSMRLRGLAMMHILASDSSRRGRRTPTAEFGGTCRTVQHRECSGSLRSGPRQVATSPHVVLRGRVSDPQPL